MFPSDHAPSKYKRFREGLEDSHSEWVDLKTDTPNEEAKVAAGKTGRELSRNSKSDLWLDWVEPTIHREIHDPEEADPIPLFETDENLVVGLKEAGSSTVLKRSERSMLEFARKESAVMSRPNLSAQDDFLIAAALCRFAVQFEDAEPSLSDRAWELAHETCTHHGLEPSDAILQLEFRDR